MDGAGVFLHGFLFEDAQDVQRGRFGRADMAGTGAARAGDIAGLGERRAQALAREFQQTKARDLAHLDARPVVMQRVAQAILDFALVLGRFHVDEVDDDQAAEVAQAQLAGNLVGCLAVGPKSRFLDVGTLGGPARVDVHRDQRLGVVDDDRASRGQGDMAGVGRLDLMLDLEPREQGHVVAVALDPGHVVRHHGGHEVLRLLENVVGVDQDLADIGVEVIADGANDQARFEVDQEGSGLRLGGALDGAPELEQVVHVPLELFPAAADAGGAGDQAHALRNLQLVHDFAQFLTIFAFDPARNAAAARVVRHEHQIAAGEGNEGGERRALVAALVFFDLNDQLLADLQGILDACAAGIDAGLEVGAGDFLERQEAVAFGAVIDEGGFEAGLDAGDDCLVDVALALFLGGRFDVEVDQLLTIDDRDAEFLGLRRIEQHAFHVCSRAFWQGTTIVTKRPPISVGGDGVCVGKVLDHGPVSIHMANGCRSFRIRCGLVQDAHRKSSVPALRAIK